MMLRKMHGLPALFAALFLMTLAATGAVLSLAPALDRSASVIPAAGQGSVAQLAGRVVARYPDTEQIVRGASGEVIVYYNSEGRPGADLVNPLTGESIAPYEPSAFFIWIKDLHRSFLLDNPGRMLAGLMSAVMLLLCISGVLLLVRRTGGWMLSALTGGYMSAQRFGLLPEPPETGPAFPAEVSGGQPAPVATLRALSEVDLVDLRELVFPYANDLQDAYSLTTREGAGFVDQATGELLKFQPRPAQGVFQQWKVCGG